MLRHCNKCGEDKARTEFYAERKRPGILSTRCKPCDRKRSTTWNQASSERRSENQRRHYRNNPETQREYLLKHKFGLSHADYLVLLQSQNGGCAICGVTTPGGRGKYFHVDHDRSCCPGHKACGGCIRGLLCHAHNTGLGLFADRPEMLLAAVEYLQARS